MSTPTERITELLSEVSGYIDRMQEINDELKAVHARHVARIATHDYSAFPHALPCADEPPYRGDDER